MSTEIYWANISELADLVSCTRETVGHRLRDYPLPSRVGRKNGREYPSCLALPLILRKEHAALVAALELLSNRAP